MREEVRALRSHYQSRRRMRKLRPAGQCHRCGMTLSEAEALGRGLDLHHVKPLSECADEGVSKECANSEENLHTLCYFCHKEWHTFWEVFNPDYPQFLSTPPFRPCKQSSSTS